MPRTPTPPAPAPDQDPTPDPTPAPHPHPHPHPPIEPYDQGLLDVGDGNRVHWEVCGNPRGKPALVVHGGPGSGRSPYTRRYFDPERYRVVLFDQRNCGRSTPHAADPATDLRHNTTAHLIADMERLRAHLGIDRWLLFGGSWGSTLILAYAETHPERVSEVVISGVTMTRRAEIAWLYGGSGRLFPEEWERFRAGAGQHRQEERERAGAPAPPELDHRTAAAPSLVAAYARLVASPDPAVRERATADWCAWEDAVLSQEPNGSPAPYAGRPALDQQALVRICSHYFSNGAWLEEGALLRDAHRLAGIPAVLVHGRHDLAGPLGTAWEVARAWPGSRLVVIEDAGHKGSDEERRTLIAALDAFAR
ncbi:alpha/beta fold hydrolase [Streptomyces sp. NPDC093085]|uniref:alpha/beta fold hydrolase n=1 Tax=Streptomyces sp. NPDC093085 TaxID=3155068 RepID=UPI0034137B36